jgi:hypothetical protein
VRLFCLENDIWPARILPLAFSDMPRTCRGTESSAVEDMEVEREFLREGEDWDGVLGTSASSSESSPPMAKGLFSSWMCVNGERVPDRLRSSTDCETGLLLSSLAEFAFRSWFCRSISCCPLSSVKVRRAWNRFLVLRMLYIK